MNISPALTPHRYIKRVETSRMDLNHHLTGGMDSGDVDVFWVLQNLVSAILIDDPRWHAAL